MPIGEFPYTIDEKGRVVIPTPFRGFVADGLVLTRGLQGGLYVFPQKVWNQIETALEEVPLIDASGQAFVRFFYSGAKRDEPDGQGRVTIPPTLREWATLSADVIIAGAPKRLEIWDAVQYQEHIKETQKHPPIPELLPDALRKLVG